MLRLIGFVFFDAFGDKFFVIWRMEIAVVNGPNLGRLGKRLPEVYGNKSLQDVESELRALYPMVQWTFFQSNHEGALIDFLESSGADGLIINGGALAHQSYALADALEAWERPSVEVHISNVFKRESFRQKSLLAPQVDGQIYGLGISCYILAAQWLIS